MLMGPVAFIDDEIDLDGSQAATLLEEIRASGRPVAFAKALPPTASEWIDHWQSLAFVILDWDLSPNSGGSKGGSELGDYQRQRSFDFIRELMTRVFCPIFVISREDTEYIRGELESHAEFQTSDGSLDPRIAVFSKSVLMGNIVEHLEERVATSPSLSALVAWELGYDAAKNRMFIDFNNLEPDWPSYVWKMAEKDSVDPSIELASVISSNLLTRFDPISFDGSRIQTHAPTSNSAARHVHHGRTFIEGSKLPSTSVLPGDIFVLGMNSDEIWMNVSPACQTTGRSGEPIQLHLVHGARRDRPTSNTKFKELKNEGESSNKFLAHTLLDEDPYMFEFGKAQFKSWDEVKDLRVGRLLPPYVTRVQQMHAAYIQSEGLPRVESSLYLGESGAVE